MSIFDSMNPDDRFYFWVAESKDGGENLKEIDLDTMQSPHHVVSCKPNQLLGYYGFEIDGEPAYRLLNISQKGGQLTLQYSGVLLWRYATNKFVIKEIATNSTQRFIYRYEKEPNVYFIFEKES